MKKGPFIFLAVLVVILMFILGVQYGKRVEVTDQAIEALLQKVPSPTLPPPQDSEPVVYKTLTSNRCGFSFIYPSSYKINITSTHSAQLLDSDQEVISFSCSPEIALDQYDSSKYTTSSASLGDAPATAYDSDEENIVTYMTTHPNRDIPFSISIDHGARLLIENTFNFIQ